ncbi:MAG: hypothetical protein M3P28_07570 [Thermoproteota archaeon]|nr:hypothetical protein [Thermoproteota archaeon]
MNLAGNGGQLLDSTMPNERMRHQSKNDFLTQFFGTFQPVTITYNLPQKWIYFYGWDSIDP